LTHINRWIAELESVAVFRACSVLKGPDYEISQASGRCGVDGISAIVSAACLGQDAPPPAPQAAVPASAPLTQPQLDQLGGAGGAL